MSFAVARPLATRLLAHRPPSVGLQQHSTIRISKKIRNFTQSPQGKQTPPPSKGRNNNDSAISTVAKYLRIPALVLGVFGFGYQMGIMDTIGDPEKKERAILESVCRSAGCADPSDRTRTRITTDGSFVQISSLANRDPQLHRIASVGRRIVQTARLVSKKQHDEELAEIRSQLPKEITSDPATFDRVVQFNETFNNPIAAAAQIMDGEWTYVLLDSPAPNAFVTSILPRKIFVTTAMMDKLVDNDDEMALVLGHEVSHLLIGHVKNRTIAEAALSTVEIVLLTTLSAAGGIGTLQAMFLLASVKRWVSNAYSRESEREADAMGIKLAAMACYDTPRGIEVFKKMEALDPPGVAFLSFELDHPPTKERYNYLVEASKEENASKYKNRRKFF